MVKRVGILGSTGSIGTQALEVIDQHPDDFRVSLLTTRNNVDLLIRQALRYIPDYVVVSNAEKYTEVKDALSGLRTVVVAGSDQLAEMVRMDELDIVLTALVGFSGLLPTIKALEAGKDIALANKETLVVAGELITGLAEKSGRSIYPVDSEHSAIFQCLAGEEHNAVEKIFLTASGGPFRGMSADDLKKVTRSQALNHPNWCMGNKVTIDSASLMNKGLEAIEAKWLFRLKPDEIDIVVHPQSIIHSMVQFRDGSIKAQLGIPDMRLPIQYALGYPERLRNSFKRFSFSDYPQLTFEEPDRKVFRNLKLAFEAMERGGNMPCIMNAANEIAVEAFLNESLEFWKMPDLIRETMENVDFIEHPDLEDYFSSDTEARRYATERI
jgi:1-deoxy-D-xylulose-5-phosphate reductoisomerase